MSYSFPTCTWRDWLASNWAALLNGEKRCVPAHLLPHPRMVGFQALSVAEDHGQSEDWALPQQDGSRIHVHVYADGALCVHRDRWDPQRDPLSALCHVLLETKVGKGLAAVAVGCVAVRAIRSA